MLRVWRELGLVLASEKGQGVGAEVQGSGVRDSELVVGGRDVTGFRPFG